MTDTPTQIAQDYYDAQNEREIAARQLIDARQQAVNDAIKRGYDQKAAQNPANWTIEQNNKVKDLNNNFQVKANVETDARNQITQYVDDESGKDPEIATKELLAAGLKPDDINKAVLYSNGPQQQKDKIITERAQQITIERQNSIQQTDKTIRNLSKEKEDLQKQQDNLDPTDPDYDDKYIALKDKIDNKQEEIDIQNKKMNNLSKPIDAKKMAQEEYDSQDPTNPNNFNNTVKLANTGFEKINNFAPFYMQFPTLKSLSDFRIRNGKSPYGEKSEDEIARDAVNFRIFESVPGVAEAREIPGTNLIQNIIDNSRIQTVGSFTIYPSDGNWITQSHTHHYSGSESDWIASTLNTVGGIYESVGSIMKTASVASQALKSGSTKGLAPVGDVYQRRAEVLKYYKESDAQNITIKFNLFTKNNFLADVFRPIMFLTALGYPKRTLSGNEIKDATKEIFKNINEWANQGNNWAQNILKGLKGSDTEKTINTISENISNVENAIGSFGGIGPYRYFISKRPEYLSVRHVSGIFYYPLANITNFTYSFKGPWYNFNGEPITTNTNSLDALISNKIKNFTPNPNSNFTDRIGQIFDNFVQESKEAFSPPKTNDNRPIGAYNTLLNLSDSDPKLIKRWYGMNYAYPSSAECEITIQSSVPFFRDDFMSLYYASNDSPEKLVEVTQQNTGDERFFGGRKAQENQKF